MLFARLSFRLLSAVAALGLAGSLSAAPLKIGVTPGSLADSVAVAAEEAKQVGLEVQVIEFTDWTTPNTALASGDLDLNYFQHQAFLDHAVTERGYTIASVAYGLLPNIGLYSKKYASLDAVPDGASVGVANDPVNQARGLLLLQAAGLIQLKDGVGAQASINDVTGNPKKLQIVEVEGPQLVRAADDLALVQGYPAHFVNAGQAELASNALQYSTVDDLYYAIRFVSRSSHRDDSRIRQFVDIYQNSPAVAAQIDKSFAGDAKLYSLPWRSAKYASITQAP
ncbi:metal ABC transporter substrate-binding protein [Alcaligenes pakistanensis]|uniref:Metal ABC transporter substrate-binding protein n=1 Tax=Alcaligenes pakistanensis TaxID=1482717 RepID=A0A8H9IQE7_9BURK|nr:MetQ/NlpA family ABC transporter substrate-binding protein [Alcaligenes pakistanensis]MBP6620947.1 MetQ/NlpA family ABC transporter substrate-binding protein [Alcaligenes sp.]GHC57089.1 metal ABC transporter substrate-binding protein [Alcaligenes pakistanensis]